MRLQLEPDQEARRARTTAFRSSYSDDAVKLIVKRCDNAEAGGRIIDSILTNTVLPKVSIEYLSRAAEGKELTARRLGVADDEFSYRVRLIQLAQKGTVMALGGFAEGARKVAGDQDRARGRISLVLGMEGTESSSAG